MKFTTFQTNMMILALLLAIIQVFILYMVNGVLTDLFHSKDLGALALIFGPTGGIIWCMKRMADYKER